MTIRLLQNTFIQPGNGNLDKWKLKTIVKKFTCKISNRVDILQKATAATKMVGSFVVEIFENLSNGFYCI